MAISFAICLFSMAGVPPLIGFFSKQMILYSAVQSGYYFMSIIAILVSVISASYYLKIVRVLFTQPEEPDVLSSAYGNHLIESDVYSLLNTPKAFDSEDAALRNAGAVFSNRPIINQSKLNNFHSFLISILTLTILLFILKPSIFLNSIQLLCLSLYNC